MAVFSKCIPTTCVEYVHPWTTSCSVATTCFGIHVVQDSFRMYFTVYMLALLMRGRIPSRNDILRTCQGITQSTAFLTCNAASFSLVTCFMRKVLGGFNVWTVAFLPGFISSYISILVERPSRRSMLSLYVTNVASETLFRMAVWRGLVRPVRHGEVLIFMSSIAALMYFYKGHHTAHDSIYSLLRFVVGPYEGENCVETRHKLTPTGDGKKSLEDAKHAGSRVDQKARTKKPMYRIISWCSAIMKRWKESIQCLSKHPKCLHPHSCLYYTLQGSSRLFTAGYGLQVCLQLLLHMKEIIRSPRLIPKQLVHRDAFRFGAFLGGFSGIYRMVSCLLRRTLDSDSKLNAIPAGLLAGLTFAFFPFNTIALYVMWKSLQMMYNSGVDAGYLPELKGATLFLYCFSTATLFHAALLEPQNLRPSYWRFMFNFSGGRIAAMDRKPLDAFGMESSRALAEVIIKTKTRLIPVEQF